MYDEFDPYEEFPEEFDEDHLAQFECKACGAEKEREFFPLLKSGEPNVRACKLCQNYARKRKRQDFKVECIHYKGSKCIVCSYNRCIGALEFHHLDPDEKDFELSSVKHTKFDRVKDELDKCVLVCANCHREIHAGMIVPYL